MEYAELLEVLRETGTTTTSKAILGDDKLAQRFIGWADSLQPKIDHLGRSMGQNPTPKRNREYQGRLHDCRNMERLQKALRALAEKHSDGTIPESLASLRTKDDIGRMVRKSTTGGGGYYSVIEADDYHDTTPPARLLQDMIEGNPRERAERERLRKIGTLEAEIALSDIPGYFPTPKDVVRTMLDRAHLESGLHVLEPSAGSGHIADAIRERCPGAVLECVEPNYRLRELLALKGHKLVAHTLEGPEMDSALYDRIIMNPPFENLTDVNHVRIAYWLLRKNGLLVAIMAPGWQFRNDSKCVQFREFLEQVGATVEDLPEGSFKSSGTGVATRMVVIQKRDTT